eukprot:4378238-Prymnesium_polylepis.1
MRRRAGRARATSEPAAGLIPGSHLSRASFQPQGPPHAYQAAGPHYLRSVLLVTPQRVTRRHREHRTEEGAPRRLPPRGRGGRPSFPPTPRATTTPARRATRSDPATRSA